MDGYLHLDAGIGIDPQEVDVDDLTAHRVALDLLDHGHLVATVHVKVEQCVEPCISGEGPSEICTLH